MKIYIWLLIFIFNLNSKIVYAQSNEISKIIIGTGNCIHGECPIEIFEVDLSLNLVIYTEDLFQNNKLLSKGLITNDLWESISKRINEFNNKNLSCKKPFKLKNGHPLVIQVFRGKKSRIFYSDVDAIDEEVWSFYENFINLSKQLEKNKVEEIDLYLKVNDKLLSFLRI